MPKVMGPSGAFVALWRAIRAGSKPGTPGIGERFKALPRMLGARIKGTYRELSWGRLALILGAVVYAISPVDFIPELVLGPLGLFDDAVVVGWIAGAVLDETERYIQWERGGRPVDADTDDVVDGEVVG
ncbi:MAG: YkvA family protein [Micromonosporaceae bacterium]